MSHRLRETRDGHVCCPVLELRQYRLHPGRRDDLIALFEREFVVPQLELGIHLAGTFTDLDDPDRFVWVRGFASHADRTQALEAFYGGPVWAAHRTAANSTMADSDDVLLLRPAPGVRFAAAGHSGELSADVFELHSARDEPAALDLVRGTAGPELRAVLRTDPTEPGFPALPVRRDTHAVVAVHGGPSPGVPAALSARCGRVQRLRLRPTTLSSWR